VYHAPPYEKASSDITGDRGKENVQRNVVTPDPKAHPCPKEEYCIGESDDHDEICPDSFRYLVDCEANPASQVLPLSASSFAYSGSSDECSISPGYGGWQTNDSNSIAPKSTRRPTGRERNSGPVVEPELTAGKTVLLLPGIPRTFYGGIRDCLPPPQILSSAPITPPSRQTQRSILSSSFPFIALQLARIEENRQTALRS
jgi:hypothetical protein